MDQALPKRIYSLLFLQIQFSGPVFGFEMLSFVLFWNQKPWRKWTNKKRDKTLSMLKKVTLTMTKYDDGTKLQQNLSSFYNKFYSSCNQILKCNKQSLSTTAL